MATSLHAPPGGQPCSFHRQIPKYLNGNDPEIRFKNLECVLHTPIVENISMGGKKENKRPIIILPYFMQIHVPDTKATWRSRFYRETTQVPLSSRTVQK